MQKVRATAFVLKNNSILMMHRFSRGEEYYVLPSGSQEENESIEKATLRELKEETNLEGKVVKEVFDYTDDISRNRLFLVEVKDGKLKVGENAPEIKKQNEQNKYFPEWVPINEILFLIIWPLQTREFLFKYFELV
jgi:8-oxo-dGTP pyrophosphatase MutT (NUDIX family)